MTTITAMNIWEASQTRPVQGFARKLWGHDAHGAEDGIQSAIVRALTRKAWFDPTKGTLAAWLMMNLKSVRQADRSKGHRRGTVSAPRVFCPGDEAMPVLPDLCDPESILIAREIDLGAVGDQRALRSDSKLTTEQVRFIRASVDLSCGQLAQRFKVSKSVIDAARRGVTYKHIS
jgi:DNA-directed RNA polymerase specialized sigma24 family protein